METVAPNEVFLFDEKNKRYLLKGRAYYLIAPYLSGRHTADEIIDILQEHLCSDDIYYALSRLQKRDFLEEAKGFSSSHAFSQLLDCPNGVQNLHKKTLSVLSLGKVSYKRFIRKLCSFSFRLTSEEESDLCVILTDQYRRKEISLLTARWEKEKKPHFLIKSRGIFPWIGPLFIPGKTRCYHCLLGYLERNEQQMRYVEKKKKLRSPILLDQAELPSSQSLALDFSANEILKWVLSGSNAEVEGKILCYDPLNSSFITHQVIRDPHCPICRSKTSSESIPISLESRQKSFVSDGGHRIVSPEETVQKYQHLISPITGIVNHLKKNPPSFFPSLSLFGASYFIFFQTTLRPNVNSTSGGKGKSEIQAKASCLCEALERYSGGFQGNEVRKRAKYRELEDVAIHPSLLLLFSEKQYQNRKEEQELIYDWVPYPFDETRLIDWTPAWSLTEKRHKWLPTAFCYYNYPYDKTEKPFCRGDSNGCAAGNNLEEAILQGFFELVERDSVALWWYSRFKCPGVDLCSFPDPYIEQTVQIYGKQGREIWALDLTTDLKIPSFAVFSRKVEGDKEEISFGFGTHFDPQIALLRALTEMGQLFCISSTREDLAKQGKYNAFLSWFQEARLSNHPYLLPDPKKPLKKYGDYSRFDTSDLKEDILQCQKMIEAKDMEMIILDQTRPEVGLSVVKVIVPGLRHFWPRFAQGRLYDIPFELGLVEGKLSEEKLNPLAMFL